MPHRRIDLYQIFIRQSALATPDPVADCPAPCPRPQKNRAKGPAMDRIGKGRHRRFQETREQDEAPVQCRYPSRVGTN